MIHLLYKANSVGIVDSIEMDGPEVTASIRLLPGAEDLRGMWQFMEVEENCEKDPPVPTEFLDDLNWSVAFDSGQRRGIYLPMVYSDGVACWRWRTPLQSAD